MSEILERLDDLWEKASDVDSLTVLDAREEIVKLRAEAKEAAAEIEKLGAALQTARRDALEEAARLIESSANRCTEGGLIYLILESNAAAIRALGEKE